MANEIDILCNKCGMQFTTTKTHRFAPTLCHACNLIDAAGVERWCIACRRSLPLDAFYDYHLSLRRRRCKACYQRKANDRYLEQSERIARIKVERGCADCGYNEHAAALDFDHLPGFTKAGQVGLMASLSWKRIEAEIAKCEVVCANCHRVRTHVGRKAQSA